MLSDVAGRRARISLREDKRKSRESLIGSTPTRECNTPFNLLLDGRQIEFDAELQG